MHIAHHWVGSVQLCPASGRTIRSNLITPRLGEGCQSALVTLPMIEGRRGYTAVTVGVAWLQSVALQYAVAEWGQRDCPRSAAARTCGVPVLRLWSILLNARSSRWCRGAGWRSEAG